MQRPDGSVLAARREAVGLTVEQLAEATAIPVDYLRSLEADRIHELPPGPYAAAYARKVEQELARAEARREAGGEPITQPSAPTAPPQFGPGRDTAATSDPVVMNRPMPRPTDPEGIEFTTVRAVALLATVLFAVVATWQGVLEWQKWRDLAPASGPGAIRVELQARENARVRVEVDGAIVADRLFAGRERASWVARDRIALDVPDLQDVHVWFEGERIHPRGELNAGRQLVFVRDGAGR